jgi:hypothetical protein
MSSSYTTITSSGTTPAEWRRYWHERARIDGTDWRTLINCAETALSQLRIIHGTSS